MLKTIFPALMAILLAVPAHAANILLVSDACAPDEGCGDNQRDDVFVDFLEDLGHAVDTSGMSEAYHSANEWWTDEVKVGAMDAADLVIVSRRTNSGAYRGGIAVQAWNGTSTPLLLMSSYLTRDSRWGWQTGGDIGAMTSDHTEMTVLVPDSPLVTDIDVEAQVFDWTSPSIGGTENDTPGMWPKNVTAPQIDSVVEGGIVVGQFDDRALLVHYTEGTNWSVADDGEGASQEGDFAADRVFMGHWGYDINNTAGDPYNFLDFVTADFLATLENTINTLAPGVVEPVGCDFDGSGTCDVADVNLLMYNGLSSGDLKYDLDQNGSVDIDDRDELLRQIGSLPGDANLDGVTNASDLNAVGSNWQKEGLTSWEQGDFDGNGIANAADLNNVGGNWQKTALEFAAAPVAAASAVPEPSSVWLLLFSLLGLTFRRRR